VVGAGAGAQADGGLGQPADLAAAADQGGLAAGVGGDQELADRLGVGAAQHCVGEGDRADRGGDAVEAAEA
jgi:hypothetical protein